jgi:hypothetical protein
MRVQELIPAHLVPKNSWNPHIHVAVIMNKKNIVSVATNRLGNRSKGVGFSTSTLHAEMHAIKQVKNLKLLENCRMYVFRQNKFGFPMMSAPCKECRVKLEVVMKKWGLKKVLYSI